MNLRVRSNAQVGILLALPAVHFLAADFAWELFKEHESWWKIGWNWRKKIYPELLQVVRKPEATMQMETAVRMITIFESSTGCRFLTATAKRWILLLHNQDLEDWVPKGAGLDAFLLTSFPHFLWFGFARCFRPSGQIATRNARAACSNLSSQIPRPSNSRSCSRCSRRMAAMELTLGGSGLLDKLQPQELEHQSTSAYRWWPFFLFKFMRCPQFVL